MNKEYIKHQCDIHNIRYTEEDIDRHLNDEIDLFENLWSVYRVMIDYHIPESIYRNGEFHLDEIENEKAKMVMEVALSSREFLMGL